MKTPIKVEIGQKIREWTIIEFDRSKIGKGRHYFCKCKCGKVLSKPISALIAIGPNMCKSCATKHRGFHKLGKPLELQGKVFGEWRVLERVFNGKRGTYWKCKCSCGFLGELFGPELKRGKSTKCRSCATKKASFKHGYGTRGNIKSEYNSWAQMKQRCLNLKDKRAKCYSGRGINICQEWIDSFESFLSYIGPKPFKTYSLDRINNDGNYEPGNVRWASAKVQANNRSTGKKK